MSKEEKDRILEMLKSPNVNDVNLAGSILKEYFQMDDEKMSLLKQIEPMLLTNKSHNSGSIWRLLSSEIEARTDDVYTWKRKGAGIREQLNDKYVTSYHPLIGMTEANDRTGKR